MDSREILAADGAVGLEEARTSLGQLALRVAIAKERIPISRHGKTIAALVPIADLERLLALDAA